MNPPTPPPTTSPTHPTPTPTAVTISGVWRTFPGGREGGVEALAPMDLEIASGGFVAIIGPSGSGKSTLLRLVAGLDQPSGGDLRVNRTEVAYVFQDANLLPWRTVLGNVALPLELRGEGRARFSAAREVLAQVELTDAVDRYPAELSGGMKMRVSLARALVTDPKLLLLDEPFAALDEITRQRLDEQLRGLWKARGGEGGMTVIFVTHSIPEATFLAQRAIVLSRRPGRVVLDHVIDLPEERGAEIRGEASFAREMRTLYTALEMGEMGGRA